jgi:hypothetical protein
MKRCCWSCVAQRTELSHTSAQDEFFQSTFRRPVGNGLEKDGQMFCCNHCAEHMGIEELRDRA